MYRLLFSLAVVFCVVEATILIPKPKPAVPSKCNIYKIDLVWVLEDCICRPIQNPCLRDELNEARIKSCRTPLVPVTKELCKMFIPKICLWGPPVTGNFPKPPSCGCPNKPGTIDERKFDNFCLMQKYSAENNEAYTSYKTWPLKKIKGICDYD